MQCSFYSIGYILEVAIIGGLDTDDYIRLNVESENTIVSERLLAPTRSVATDFVQTTCPPRHMKEDSLL